ncbi:MAG: pseudouridine kinase [Actinomycetota bacterium]|nr:pseudouridine kinase [Actinomycetota bacterium]
MVPSVLCAGGIVLDRHLRLLAAARPGTSNPARASTSPGGVARNVAENLALLGVPVRLCSRVGDDDAGRELLTQLAVRGVGSKAVRVVGGVSTASYVAVLDPAGDLVLGVAAMDVLDGITPEDLLGAWPRPGEWLFLDCNLPAPVLAAALRRAASDGTPVAVDAVSTPKVTRLAGGLAGTAVLFCNFDEARALLAELALSPDGGPPALADRLLGAGARAVVLTLGPDGAVVADGDGPPRTVPGIPARVVDVTGAGDALVATTLSHLVTGGSLDEAVRAGVREASLTVAVPESVRGKGPGPGVQGPGTPGR